VFFERNRETSLAAHPIGRLSSLHVVRSRIREPCQTNAQ
jgi:hypothetical protein